MQTKLRIFNWMIFNLIIFNLINLQSGNAQMYWNQACSFAGNSSSYVSLPNSSSIDLTGSFTIEAWVNPLSLTGASKGILSKGGSLGTSLKYGIRITTAGRITILTNGAQRLISTTSTPVLINKWTHISCIHNSSTSTFAIYINGNLDTTAIVAGATPTANPDSLFIGISGSSTPFNGQLDEVRLWNRELSSTDVIQFFRTSLSTTGGRYSGLALSMTFQRESNTGGPFTVKDFSTNNNHGNARNTIAKSQTYGAYTTISHNECIELDGNDDYLVGKDTTTLQPVDSLTLSCWVYPRDYNSGRLIGKQSGSTTNYGLHYNSGVIQFIKNNNAFNVSTLLPLNKWTHITVSFRRSFMVGNIRYYINGKSFGGLSIGGGGINTDADSLYIGGGPGPTTDFNGFIDEVRISKTTIFSDEAYAFTHKSLEKSNDPDNMTTDISYNFDGSTYDNAENGGPVLSFGNDARFSHPSTIPNQPRSPMNNDEPGNYTNGYYVIDTNARIPASGASGTVSIAKQVNLNVPISDVNVFVNLNHTNSSNLKISLISPSSDSLVIFNNNISNSLDNNISLIFDDQADSSLKNNSYNSFSSKIKPANNLNSRFGGQSPKGQWRLTVSDEVTGDTGVLNSWGLIFNNLTQRPKDLRLFAMIQGFYNPTTNLMNPDSMTVYIRIPFSPFAIVDSSKVSLNSSGLGLFSFPSGNLFNDWGYLIQLKHRNSIETWSNNQFAFIYGEASYSFLNSASAAYGDNQIQVDFPALYAIYGADVNQDGVVDATDAGAIDNDAFNFVTGYVQTDLTGDDVVDASDASIADNNASNFVTAITP